MPFRLIVLIMLANWINADAQNRNHDKRMVNITSSFPKSHFDKTIEFVLQQGVRRTYCNMYNNSPHIIFGDVKVYLNPVSQSINYTQERLSANISDYDEIVGYDSGARRYYMIKRIGDQVFCKKEDENLVMNLLLPQIIANVNL